MGFGEKSHCFDTSATCPSFVRWLQGKKTQNFQVWNYPLYPQSYPIPFLQDNVLAQIQNKSGLSADAPEES